MSDSEILYKSLKFLRLIRVDNLRIGKRLDWEGAIKTGERRCYSREGGRLSYSSTPRLKWLLLRYGY